MALKVIVKRIITLLEAIEQRTNYLSLLLENQRALTHLIRLADASPWIITFLSRHPVLLDELLDARTLYAPPDRDTLQKALHLRMAKMPAEDLEYQMEALCIFQQVNTLKVAAADITEVLPLMKVSDALTFLAEVVLEAALEYHFAAPFAGPRPELHNVVRRVNHRLVVFHHHDGVTTIAQTFNSSHQPVDVGWVQADRWLVEHI